MRLSSIRLLISIFFFGLSLGCAVASAAEQPKDFQTWLNELRAEALAKNISQKTIDSAFKDIELNSRVVELDQKQPEFALTFTEYLQRVVPQSRVDTARDKLHDYRKLLRKISKKYNVQPRFIVALWGVETDFGRLTGGFSVVQALTTLAYDGRRSNFFRNELFNALRILDDGHITLEKMQGSWAGAMGQCQFMPSSFLQFAQDADGDGRRNIWESLSDVFASTANYLSRSGWDRTQTWGREVQLPKGFDENLTGLKHRKRLSQWQALGVRRLNGRNLPKRNLLASLIQPDGPTGPAFLVYDNYQVILKWNRSHSFGVAVGTLADRMVGR